MQSRTLTYVLAAALLVACGGPKPVQQEKTVEKMTAEQRLEALLDELWDLNMRTYPGWATYQGIRTYDDRLGDMSEEAEEAYLDEVEAIARRVEAIPPAELDPMERDTREMVLLNAKRHRAEKVCHGSWWEVDGLGGPQVDYAMMPVFFSIRNAEDLANLETRYRATKRQIAQINTNLRRGVQKGYAPTKTNVERALKQLDELLEKPIDAEHPMLRIKPTDEGATYDTSALKAAVEEAVLPALRSYRKVLREEVLPVARPDQGIADLPTGKECYAARIERHIGPGYAAEELHQRGRDELARIHAGMVEVGRELGLENPTAFDVIAWVKGQRSHYATSEEELIEKNAAVVERARLAMPRAFGRLPKTPVEMRPLEEHRAKDAPAAYYYSAPEDGSRPAYYYVNTSDPQTRPLFNLEALAFHEAIPGHHQQIALAQELPDVHIWRRNAGQTAFVEGWALYAEILADELGLYSSPLMRFGMYNYQAWRACRLVIDTGLHSMGWTRQQAIDFLSQNTALPENEVANEVDRYIAWPGQALAYMVGRMKIQELRQEAETELGDAYSLRAFDDAVNARGAVPLTILETNIDAWRARMAEKTADLPDFKDLWNFDDPAATETKFRELLDDEVVVQHPTYGQQLLTQIARTYSLRGKFDEAHAQLDEIEPMLATAEPVVKVRYLLERGRTYNSANQKDEAKPLFLEAWKTAKRAGIDGLAVDAAHMLAIAEGGEAAVEWNRTALRFAEASTDPAAKTWLGALYNNLGWSHHDAGRFDKALEMFEKGYAWRKDKGQGKPTRVAKWSVARALRSLERYDEALKLQLELEQENRAVGEPDGFVFEELGELYLSIGEKEKAQAYFAKAHPLLKDLDWVAAERLQRIEKLARSAD